MYLSSPKYKYSETYQRKLAAYIIRDPFFLLGYPDTVEPSYFDFDYLSSIVRIVKEFSERYQSLPTWESLCQALSDYCVKFQLEHALLERMLQEVMQLYHVDLSDGLGIRDKIIKFAKRQALRTALLECGHLIQRPDDEEKLDQARGLVDKALSVGENINNLGTNMGATVMDLPKVLAADQNYASEKKIPTMIPSLDAAQHGGPGRGQIWVVLAKSGMGKSMWLTNVGVAALTRGLPVVHYTLGDLQEQDVQLRYAIRMTGMATSEILMGGDSYANRVREIQPLLNNLLIKYYPSEAASVSTLRSHLSICRSLWNWKPALIIVDYADELSEMSNTDNTYRAGGSVYAGLSQIAYDWDALVWTASQINRYTPMMEDIITSDGIAESKKKVDKSDGIVTLNQTQTEYENKEGRIWVDKVRRGKGRFKIKVKMDFKYSLIREIEEEEQAPESNYVPSNIANYYAQQAVPSPPLPGV